MRKNSFVILAIMILSIASTQVNAEVDLKKGKKLYKKCLACHFIDKEKNKIGPHLKNVIGRTAGTLEKYRYSPAMKKKGKEGLIWNDESLDKYLEKPRKFVKGTKMIFPGLKKEADRKNLIAYLKTFSEPVKDEKPKEAEKAEDAEKTKASEEKPKQEKAENK